MSTELIIVPGSSRFDVDDSRFRSQTALLYQDLQRNVDGFTRRSDAVPGTKGAVETVAVLLGAGGGLTALAQCFKAWLERDKTRSITINLKNGAGKDVTWTFDGDAIDRGSLQTALNNMAALTGDGREEP